MTSSKTHSFSLDKGKYILSYIVAYSGTNNSKVYSDNSSPNNSMITCNNCTKQLLSSKYIANGGKGYGSANVYLAMNNIVDYVEVLSNTDTISLIYGWESYAPLILSFQVIPINE